MAVNLMLQTDVAHSHVERMFCTCILLITLLTESPVMTRFCVCHILSPASCATYVGYQQQSTMAITMVPVRTVAGLLMYVYFGYVGRTKCEHQTIHNSFHTLMTNCRNTGLPF